MDRTFPAKKSLGQNFLTNPGIADKIASAARIAPGDTVFEIGPGTGMLTKALLAHGAQVIAVEADIRAVETLRETLAAHIADSSLTLIHGDMRTLPLTDIPLPARYIVAANIPYYLTGMLMRALLSAPKQPERMVFLVQKEVAERVARDKKESLLSLSVKVFGTPKYLGTVSRGNFSPSPNVDSAILLIDEISRKNLAKTAEDHFFSILKAGFGARRKQLKNNLADSVPADMVSKAFETLGLPPTVRGEDLDVTTWIRLAELTQS